MTVLTDEMEREVSRLERRQLELGLPGVGVIRGHTFGSDPANEAVVADTIEANLVQNDPDHPIGVIRGGYPGAAAQAPYPLPQRPNLVDEQLPPGSPPIAHDLMGPERHAELQAHPLQQADHKIPHNEVLPGQTRAGVVMADVPHTPVVNPDEPIVYADRLVKPGEGIVGMPPVLATSDSARAMEIAEMNEREAAQVNIPAVPANDPPKVYSAPEDYDAERAIREKRLASTDNKEDASEENKSEENEGFEEVDTHPEGDES